MVFPQKIINLSSAQTNISLIPIWLSKLFFMLLVSRLNDIPFFFFLCTFGLTQKYQKIKAEYCIATKPTREIIPAIQAVRLVHLFFLSAFVKLLIGKR